MSNYEATSRGLFKDGVQITPEYGNEEQIKAIRKYEQLSKELKEEGHVIEPEWQVIAKFKCLCGGYLESSKEDIGDMDLSDFEGETVECGRCGQEYDFYLNDWDELTVKTKES